MIKKSILTLIVGSLVFGCTQTPEPVEKYKPTWNSLSSHQIPEWFRDAKFGIYTHWGIYSVPAKGPNGSWYPHNMYKKETGQYEYHVANYGDPSDFGYKDFLPLFKAEKFDADEWAELFLKSGAKFAGPVAEHHDGFPMWDSKWTEYDASEKSPQRDIVGELEKAIYGTRAWILFGEGPTEPEAGGNYTEFDEGDFQYTGQDIRFTVKDDVLYAICLDWPGEEVTIHSLRRLEEELSIYWDEDEIESIHMLGEDQELEWFFTEEGLTIKTPSEKPCDHAYAFKIQRNTKSI